MDTKLTLRLDMETIDRAKTYAREKKMSLSQLIENYLNFITAENSEASEVTPLVKSLSATISLPDTYDEKQAYRNHLSQKYSK